MLNFSNMTQLPQLSSEEEKKLQELVRDFGDNDARDKLILHNLKIVKEIAQWYQSQGVEADDLFQEGTVRLVYLAEQRKVVSCFFTYMSCSVARKIRSIKKQVTDSIHNQIEFSGENEAKPGSSKMFEIFQQRCRTSVYRTSLIKKTQEVSKASNPDRKLKYFWFTNETYLSYYGTPEIILIAREALSEIRENLVFFLERVRQLPKSWQKVFWLRHGLSDKKELLSWKNVAEALECHIVSPRKINKQIWQALLEFDREENQAWFRDQLDRLSELEGITGEETDFRQFFDIELPERTFQNVIAPPPDDLTDIEWERIKPVIKPYIQRQAKACFFRRVIDGILYMRSVGCFREQTPKDRYCSGLTCSRYLKNWQKDGTWDHIARIIPRAGVCTSRKITRAPSIRCIQVGTSIPSKTR